MKATGIIRRVDDLGRVVIPKEIRRVLNIKDGDPLEIYIEDGAVVYRKYSPLDSVASLAKNYADVLNKMTNHEVVITNRDFVVAVSGVSSKDYLERRISPNLEDYMGARKEYYKFGSKTAVYPVEGIDREAKVICLIKSNGDVLGSVILLTNGVETSEINIKLTQNTAALLSSHLSE